MVVARSTSLIPLLSNYACDVGARGDRRLVCNCSGLAVTIAFSLGALLGLVTVFAFAMLMSLGDNLVPSFVARGAMGALLGAGLSAAMGTVALQRYRRHGRFELDAERAVLRHYRGARMIGEYSFRDLLRFWLVLDPTDVQLPALTMPSWLQVTTRSGEVFRLAKGTEEELAPVCAALRKMGLAFDAPRLD